MRLRRGTSSKYKGVSWNKSHKKWQANITISGKLKYLGQFNSEEAAAMVYDEAATDYFGEFAHTNFNENRPGSTESGQGLFG